MTRIRALWYQIIHCLFTVWLPQEKLDAALVEAKHAKHLERKVRLCFAKWRPCWQEPLLRSH